MYNIENIAFSSGGINGISYCGVIRSLEEQNILNNIKRYSGSSVGAIFAILLNIGYTSSEIAEIINIHNFSDLKDKNDFLSNIFRLIFSYGFHTCFAFYDWIGDLLEKKGFLRNCTFHELFSKTQKELIITGTNLNKLQTIYYSYIHTPEMYVRDALRISVSIPLYFEPIEEHDEYYIDGGVFCHCPINVFEEYDPDLSKSIGIYIQNNVNNVGNYKITNVFHFINILFKAMANYAERFQYKLTYIPRTIFIDPKGISSIDFSLDIEKKRSLVRKGYRQTNKFFT